MGRDEDQERTAEDLARVRAGDPSAFAHLYERIAPSLDAWSRLRVSGPLRDFGEPGDVVQEVWWRAMDSFERYDPEKASFRAWLFRIATNVLLEWTRQRQRRARIEPQALAERTASLPAVLARQATSVGRDVAQRESVGKLIAVVKDLTPEDRAVFIHCGLEGKTAVAAAPLVRAEPEAVAKRWQRLRQKLAINPVWSEFDPAAK